MHRMGTPRWLLALAAVSAAAGSVPGLGGWTAFVCLVPGLVLVLGWHRARVPWPTQLLGGALLGGGAGILALHWMVVALWRLDPRTVPLFVAVPLYFSVYGAVGVAVVNRMLTWGVPLVIAAPAGVAGLHWLLGHQGPLSLPWLTMLAPLAGTPVLLQPMALIGASGLVAIVGLVNALLALSVVRSRVGRRAFPLVLAALSVVWFLLASGQVLETRMVRRRLGVVGALRTDFGWRSKWDAASSDSVVSLQTRLTRERIASQGRPSLIVWPEASLPGYPRHHGTWGRQLTHLAADGAGMVAAGGLLEGMGSDDRHRNAVYVADGSRFVPFYAKQELVPLLEFAPDVVRGIGALWWVGRTAPGGRGRLLTTPIGPVGFALCHEAAFGRIVGDYRRRGAVAVVNPSNDAWLSGTLGVRQLEAGLVLVAIRYRITIVRASNRGSAMIIDPLGHRTFGSGPLVVDTLWVPAAGSLSGVREMPP